MDAQQIGTNLNGPWLTFFSHFANSFSAKKSVAYLGHTNRSFELGQEKVKERVCDLVHSFYLRVRWLKKFSICP